VDRIKVPVHITTAYQDEQTGGRGATHVYDHLSDRIAKRLVMVNGQHSTQTEEHVFKDRIAWMDYWMLGKKRADIGMKSGTVGLARLFGKRGARRESSRVILGYQAGGRAVGEIASNGYPLRQTRFTDVFVSRGGKLTLDRRAVRPGSATWVNGSRRQAYSFQAGRDNGGQVSSPSGPDELELSTRFARPTTLAGPVTATLWVSSASPDTELFVQLIDRAPDGTLLYLNRGMLRGSHRAVNAGLSQKTRDGRIYRPWRTHGERELFTPGQPVRYLLDVFPFGHVFLPGHELVVKVHAPPADDNDWAYVLKTPPGPNTLHFGGRTPSRLMLPIVPMRAVRGFTPPRGPCAYASMRCLPGGG
jgi:hypothetical protein